VTLRSTKGRGVTPRPGKRYGVALRSFASAAVLAGTVALGGCSTNFAGADGSRGYGATGTLEIRPDPKAGFVAVFAIETRDNLSRFQLLSISQNGSGDPKAAAALPPIPSNLVFVIDRGTREVTIWSPQSKHYFRSSLDRLQQTASGASPAADPTPALSEPDPAPLQRPAATAAATNGTDSKTGTAGGTTIGAGTATSSSSPNVVAPPLPSATPSSAGLKPRSFPWLALLKQMPPVELTVAGAGTERVDGHATTALDITATMASPKSLPQRVTQKAATHAVPAPKASRQPASPHASTAQKAHGQGSPAQSSATRTAPAQPAKVLIHMNLADEYEGFPLSIRVRVPDARPGKTPMELRLHMTNVLASSPPPADFAPPEGYEAVDSPAALIAPGLGPN
jgi:hypothetical protein